VNWPWRNPKTPVPGGAIPPEALATKGLAAVPRAASPGTGPPPLPRRTPPRCPDCGAPLSYSISVWDCDQIRIYGPSGRLTGATLCLDGEMRRLPL
jgi:hypothetical protein